MTVMVVIVVGLLYIVMPVSYVIIRYKYKILYQARYQQGLVVDFYKCAILLMIMVKTQLTVIFGTLLFAVTSKAQTDTGAGIIYKLPISQVYVYTCVHIQLYIITSIKIEVGYRDDIVPKTVDTRRHCKEE